MISPSRQKHDRNTDRVSSNGISAPGLALVASLVLSACTPSYSPEVANTIQPLETIGFMDRAVSETQGDVVVRVAALSAAESHAAFGLPLAKRDIQPIWVEIDNRAEEAFYFLPISVDPDYFSPFELAWIYRPSGSESALRDAATHFDRFDLPILIPGKSTVSGFVYANLDQGAKAVAIDLIGEDHHVKSFEFVVKVPGLRADFLEHDWPTVLAETEFQDLDAAGLRSALEGLPCCALGGDRESPGDPLNIVVIGTTNDAQILFPFIRRGWDLTETTYAGSVWGTVKSSLFGSRYRYSPVSPLYVFDRPQDIAMQKARATVDERNHLRLWLTPYRYHGKEVFIGQISRDVGIRLSSKTFVTHKIEPTVDEARNYLTQDLIISNQVSAYGFVKGVGEIDPDAPRYNFTLDPYWSDGLRAVHVLEDHPVDLKELEFLEWETPKR
jgi:hypothetical protein